MPKAADAAIPKANGTSWTVDGADVTLASKDEYGEGLSKALDNVLGSPDPVIYGAQLVQKVMHAMLLLGFAIGNMAAIRGRRMGRGPAFMGLVW